jgi:hypothetical protein
MKNPEKYLSHDTEIVMYREVKGNKMKRPKIVYLRMCGFDSLLWYNQSQVDTTCDFFASNSFRSHTFITELIIAITSTLITARDFMTEKLRRRLR